MTAKERRSKSAGGENNRDNVAKDFAMQRNGGDRWTELRAVNKGG